MPNLRNYFILTILFSFFLMGCSKKEATDECDKTRFACIPKTEEVTASEIVASEPVLPVEDETIQTANVSNNEWKLDPQIEAKLPALFSKEIDPDFDWTVLESSLIEDGTYTGVDVIQVAMAYHHRQDPLVCNVDVIWEGHKVTLGLENRTKCIENYPNAS